jgi:hypothetical protein
MLAARTRTAVAEAARAAEPYRDEPLVQEAYEQLRFMDDALAAQERQ